MVEDQALIFIVFTFTGILLGILFDFLEFLEEHLIQLILLHI